MSKICVYKGFCHRKMANGECFMEGRLNGEACPDYQEPVEPTCPADLQPEPEMPLPPTVSKDPVMEAIARKLSGINGVPPDEQAQMIKRAAKAGATAITQAHDSEVVSKAVKEFAEKVKELVIDGLITDGSHHKQWYLEQILIALGIDVDKLHEEYERDYDWERGIAP